MFCTNCGEQMRDSDKFCAECGAPAAPRPAKKRAVAEAQAEPLAPPQAPPSPTRAARPAQPAMSPLEQQQVLLEAEEIASVRGMVPVETLPEMVPITARKAARAAATQTCESCGRANPAQNRFCENCGRALQAAPPPSVPTPSTQTSWLDSAEPASRPVAVAPPLEAPAAPAPAPATATNDNFFYYYDDKASHRGNRKLLIVLLVVLVLAIGGVAYLMLRPSAKSAAAGNVAVTIAPTEARVAADGTQDFAATVKGTGDIDVTWSVAEGSAGGTLVNRGAQAEGGSVATMAIYSAPKTPGTYHVVATSKADPAKSAAAEVTVTEK